MSGQDLRRSRASPNGLVQDPRLSMSRTSTSQPMGEERLQSVSLFEPVYDAKKLAAPSEGDEVSVFADDEAPMYSEYIAVEVTPTVAHPAGFYFYVDIIGIVENLMASLGGM